MSTLSESGVEALRGPDEGAWLRAKRRAGVARRPEPMGSRGVPLLCPRLAALLDLPRGAGPGPLLLAAAINVGVDTRVLKPGRFRLLYLAWVQERSLAGIGRLIGVKSVGAVRQRLVRVSDAIENRLAHEVAAILRDRPAACGGGHEHAEGTQMAPLRAALLRALEMLAHG